jgi:hypothetical protein
MSYAADMGAKRHYSRDEAAQLERKMVDRIAQQLDLQPIPEDSASALGLGVAWGTEGAYALADILAELADQREPQQYTMQDPKHAGVMLGDEIDCDFHDPHADADPAEHTIPYGWIRTVADAHYGGRVPQVLQDMQLTPAALTEFGRDQVHAREVRLEIGKFQHRRGHCPGIFTERLQAVNSYLQQIENEGDDA